jgi:2-oxoisovalerate dehydrogenase E1 component
MLRPLLDKYGDRMLNSPLAEGAVLGACVGAALAGLRPIGEMQFNDFVATGFNQLVNNAAKIRYRWGGSVPMVVRMPWGGLRHAGPYHSQNTEPWFYRTPGLKIVTPSTPHDARALMAAAVADPDPVLYYEHIALYRDPRVKQAIEPGPPAPIPIGRAALRRAGATWPSSPTGRTCMSPCAWPAPWRKTASRRPCSTCAASSRSIARRSFAWPVTPARS